MKHCYLWQIAVFVRMFAVALCKTYHNFVFISRRRCCNFLKLLVSPHTIYNTISIIKCKWMHRRLHTLYDTNWAVRRHAPWAIDYTFELQSSYVGDWNPIAYTVDMKAASDLSESDEEQLFVGEVDGRESWLAAVLGCPVFVRVVRRLQSTAVCDVLTERLTPSKLYSQSLETN